MSEGMRLEKQKTLISSWSNPSLSSPDIPTLANPVRGFGLQPDVIQKSSNLQQAQSQSEQLLDQDTSIKEPLVHDISRISLRQPEADGMAQRVNLHSSRTLAPNIIQRNSDAAQNYTPPAANATMPSFRNNHTPNNFDVNTALNIHAIRGNIPRSTIIYMTNDEAREEIEGYLLGLSDNDSDNLLNFNVANFTFVTAQQYSFIETSLDSQGTPQFARAEVGNVRIRTQWNNNAGYYQIYHCDGAV
ncbi:hypothetical protein NSTC745_03291 [Nostoc sp. DSM 114161]|jgi:hypothetical protein|uniref:hypothetical protein n=1 Tax=Nostoc sp. DSM 114161 TaxID=3440143 RepID=UPI0040462A41